MPACGNPLGGIGRPGDLLPPQTPLGVGLFFGPLALVGGEC